MVTDLLNRATGAHRRVGKEQMKRYIFIRTWSPDNPTMENPPTASYVSIEAVDEDMALLVGEGHPEIREESNSSRDDHFAVDYVIEIPERATA